jgi:membrane-bound lytic murein transglycosylase B
VSPDNAGASRGRILPVRLIVGTILLFAIAVAALAWVVKIGSVAGHDGEVAPPRAAAPAVTATNSQPQQTAAPAPRGAAIATADPAWLDRNATATGIPRVALDAYARAALAESSRRPACGIGWNTIAAIGYVESAHGTVHGGAVDAAGTVAPPIVGPALDGTVYAAVADTDGGRWDGDERWDHAIGPLQFLPSTWERYAVDADGDGVANPENLVDASLAAADYLCVAGGDLSDGVSWDRAIRAYNPADGYLASVRANATAYAQRAVR